MHHMSHAIIKDQYNKIGSKWDKVTQMKGITINSDNLFSNERLVEQNKHLISKDAELNYKDEIQEDGSMFFDRKLEKHLETFALKKKKKSTDPTKPLTTSEEPSHYSEFARKLDHLVGKVADLAKSSSVLSVKVSEGIELHEIINKSMDSIKIPSFQQKYPNSYNVINKNISKTLVNNMRQGESFFNQREYADFAQSNCLHKKMNTFCNDRNNVQKLDSQYLTYRVVNKYGTLTETVPPILNDNIKYIRVSVKDLIKKEYNLDNDQEDMLEKQTCMQVNLSNIDKTDLKIKRCLSHDTISEFINLNNYIQEIISVNEIKQETFQTVISGHLTKHKTPLFIIHKNYTGSNVLSNNSLDFKYHKKEGNVDVFLTGKFFQNNILIENDKGEPSALDLKSHTLLIDSKSTITRERFKQTFHLGLFDAILEGEFVKNSETLQYIPIFSLDIVKHRPTVEHKVETEVNESLIAVETSRESPVNIPKHKTKTDDREVFETSHSTKTHECVSHSKNLQENNLSGTSKNNKTRDPKEKSKESMLKKLESTFLKLFFRNRRNNDSGSHHENSAQNTSGIRNTKRKGKDKEVIQTNEINNKKGKNLSKNKETRKNKDRKPQKNLIFDVNEVNTSDESCSGSKRDLKGKKINGSKDTKINSKSVKKKRNKHNNIMENPGVTQVQGFFFQT